MAVQEEWLLIRGILKQGSYWTTSNKNYSVTSSMTSSTAPSLVVCWEKLSMTSVRRKSMMTRRAGWGVRWLNTSLSSDFTSTAGSESGKGCTHNNQCSQGRQFQFWILRAVHKQPTALNIQNRHFTKGSPFIHLCCIVLTVCWIQ